MSPSFIRNSRGVIGVVLVKYKSIELPTMFNKDAEIVSNVMLVVNIGSQLRIYYENTARILGISDLTETEKLNVKEYYDLDEKFYPRKSEIDKGMSCALEQINHCISKCITGILRFRCDLKWPGEKGRNNIRKFIEKTLVGSLILDVNYESANKK